MGYMMARVSLLLLLVLSVLTLQPGCRMPDPERIRKSTIELNAGYDAKKAVRKRMRSPGSTEFPGMQQFAHGDGVVIVVGQYDSQNGFGATIRGRYAAKFSIGEDGESVTLEALEID